MLVNSHELHDWLLGRHVQLVVASVVEAVLLHGLMVQMLLQLLRLLGSHAPRRLLLLRCNLPLVLSLDKSLRDFP